MPALMDALVTLGRVVAMSSSTESTMLHGHVSTATQKRQTKHWLSGGPCAFLMATIGAGETRVVKLQFATTLLDAT